MASGITFDKASVAAFDRAINNVFDQTQRSAAETVKYASIRFAMSGRANTKVGKKNRAVVANTGKGAKWLVVVKHQKKPDTFLPTNRKTDPRRVIKYRGAAKNSWNGVFRRLNRPAASSAGGGKGSRWGTAKQIGMKTHNPAIIIENFTAYMLEAFPALLGTAYNKAAKAMQYQLDRKVSREFEKAFK